MIALNIKWVVAKENIPALLEKLGDEAAAELLSIPVECYVDIPKNEDFSECVLERITNDPSLAGRLANIPEVLEVPHSIEDDIPAISDWLVEKIGLKHDGFELMEEG
jgi:hypothetical protein